MTDVKDVLLVIDMQNDFMSGGTLAVPRADEIVPVINRLAQRFSNVVLTQDWHPRSHLSFVTNHPGRQPFETVAFPYGEQVLWPSHCVQNSPGAALHADLDVPHARAFIRKGYRPDVDSYSAFIEADHLTRTGLAGYLHEAGITRVWCCGVAFDFCVAYSALDARAPGFEVAVVEDATRAINLNDSLRRAWRAMSDACVERVLSQELLV